MANSFNQVTIVGNLGRNPEMRYTPAGKPVTTFSVATTRQWNNASGETQKETAWFRITVWGPAAEACNKYLVKGAKVAVLGRMTPDENGNPRIWTGDDGKSRASFEVTADQVHFLSSGNGGNGASAANEEGEQVGDEEEIPF